MDIITPEKELFIYLDMSKEKDKSIKLIVNAGRRYGKTCMNNKLIIEAIKKQTGKKVIVATYGSAKELEKLIKESFPAVIYYSGRGSQIKSDND